MQEFIIIIMQTDDSIRIYDSTILGTQFSPIGNLVQSYWEHASPAVGTYLCTSAYYNISHTGLLYS